MGYIIPTQPTQAQIYANRMHSNEYNFAYVGSVQKVHLRSLFRDHLIQKERLNETAEEDTIQADKKHVSSKLPLYKGFIQPNPINLSPVISEISGKGNNVNLYI